MRALIFIQNLKQTLIELDEVSHRHFMFQISNYEIEQKVKSHALKELNKIEDINQYYNDLSQFSQNLLNRENFKKRLRYCYIKLNEFEIPDKERLPYIILLKQLTMLFTMTGIMEVLFITIREEGIKYQLMKCLLKN